MTVTALIVAAGSGSRMGGDVPKQYRPIASKSVLAHAVDALASHPRIDAVRVVIGEGQQEAALEAVGARDVGELILGGETRQESVRLGLEALSAQGAPDIVLIHDAARPFCPFDVIDRLLKALATEAADVPALPAADTLMRGKGKHLGDTGSKRPRRSTFSASWRRTGPRRQKASRTTLPSPGLRLSASFALKAMRPSTSSP